MIVSLKEYKLSKGIVPPNSPYFTKSATPEQIELAIILAKANFDIPYDYRGKPPYAVVIGYEDSKGRVRLLKGQIIFPTKHSFETMGGMATMKTVAIIKDNGL